MEPRFLLDTEITDEQIREYSLRLFGGPDENLVTRELATQIPLSIEGKRVSIDGHSFEAPDAAVAMVYPHPLNRDRYVSITAATSPTGMFFANLLPSGVDFVVSDCRLGGENGPPEEELHIVSGCFDATWSYRDEYCIEGNAAERAKAASRIAPVALDAGVDGVRLMLSQLLESKSSGSFAQMMRDSNWQGKPITLDGTEYYSGIGVQVLHQPCTVTYDLAGAGWTRLRATIGIEIADRDKLEKRQKDNTRVFFVVAGDGKELYKSPVFRWDSKSVEMDVDVAGVKKLRLTVDNEAAWHNAATSVDWADSRLER